MPARATARHRTDAGVVAALTGRRRRRRTRRLGPPLLLAAVLATTSTAITSPSDAALQVPAPTTATVGG